MRLKTNGITFQAKADRKAEILIYDDIGGFFSDVTAKSFSQELKALGDVDEINVRLNSGGGSVFDGVAIYNSLKRHPARVVVDVDGIAASIASIVAMAGDEINMAAGAFMMIHDPWTMAGGNAKAHREIADTLDKIGGTLLAVYADKTELSAEDLTQMMGQETWMTADEAKNLGFIDDITDRMAIAAHCDLTRFQNAPAALNGIAQPEKVELSASIKAVNAQVAQTLRKRNL